MYTIIYQQGIELKYIPECINEIDSFGINVYAWLDSYTDYIYNRKREQTEIHFDDQCSSSTGGLDHFQGKESTLNLCV